MAAWAEDLTVCTTEEILQAQEKNREWSKALRSERAALVNDRLKKEISSEQYAAHRSKVGEEERECRRRAGKLLQEIDVRTRYQSGRGRTSRSA
ncbi:MAG: hypothetical protein JNL98_19840 [Bryobacterales bacterium]|nr:hypothetical protein [Bryobacterales bacterium]